MNVQLSHAETQPPTPELGQSGSTMKNQSKHRKVMIVLSICMALQMTAYVMILPLFARRFDDFNAGVAALGTSSMAYALAATVAAPFMGALADRFGRRKLVLASLAVYALAFTGYLLAASAPQLVILRGLAGAFTAGLIPAVMGIVADLSPVNRRAQWLGIVDGGASVGWIAGPILGGFLYDRWGYNAALTVSIVIALVSFITALVAVPETRTEQGKPVGEIRRPKTAFHFRDAGSTFAGLRDSLPGPLSSFIVLLWIYFAVMFTWAFIEPRFMFYTYDSLGWNSSMLGLVMSTYGVAMALGEFSLSRLSDRLGRKPVILLGLALFSAQFIGLAFSRNYLIIAAAFVIAGLGNALFDPALTASIMDISPIHHRARMLGIKSTAGSLGSILGPALIVLFTSVLEPRTIFLVSVGIVVLTAVAGLATRIGERPPEKISPPDYAGEKASSSQILSENNEVSTAEPR